MAFLWIFALAIVAVATEKPQAPGPVDGCEDPPTTPKPKEHGIVTDVNSCKKAILTVRGRPVPALCEVSCPPPRKNYSLPKGTVCLKFSKEPFLQERKETSRNKPPFTCMVGFCNNGECIPAKIPHKVPCTVPRDRRDWRE
uniref:Evasin n=1 Tax=Amblyomma parvum TaxID=251391 RepID=A0A023G2D8_AMBPA